MKRKILNALLVLTSLVGYLEWGTDNHAFLVQAEVEVLRRLFDDPMSVLHPLTLGPFLGQMLLIATLFQKQPGKVLTIAGLVLIGVLIFFVCLVGIISLNTKILLSTHPFCIVAAITIREVFRK